MEGFRQCALRSANGAFKISPERNNCPPSESNGAVKKGFQGSGPDLALNFVVPAV